MISVKDWKHWLAIDLILLIYIVYFIFPLIGHIPNSYSVKNFPQLTQPDDITCGPTSIAMVLRYYGRNVGIEELRYKAKTTWFEYKNKAIGMTSPEYLVSVLKEYGIDSALQQGNLRSLKYYVSQNRLPIVLLRSGDRSWHYVVIIGYDQSSILVSDPSGSQYKIPSDHFMGAWDFSTDMEGNYIGNDFYRFLILMAEVQSKTYIVPKFPPN